jgi:4'-phosphopantetheinyl transferase
MWDNDLRHLCKKLCRQIHVWQVELDQPPAVVGELFAMLSGEEKKRIAQFRTPDLRRRQAVAHGVLRALIASYLNSDPAELAFSRNSHGKPQLKRAETASKLQFNLSHSEDVAAYCFANHTPVGIDVETIGEIPDLEGVAALCLSGCEQEWFYQLPLPERNETFYTIWSIKEAFVKAIGWGLSFPLNQVEVRRKAEGDWECFRVSGYDNPPSRWRIFTFAPTPEATAAMVTKAHTSEIRCFRWGPGLIHEALVSSAQPC